MFEPFFLDDASCVCIFTTSCFRLTVFRFYLGEELTL